MLHEIIGFGLFDCSISLMYFSGKFPENYGLFHVLTGGTFYSFELEFWKFSIGIWTPIERG